MSASAPSIGEGAGRQRLTLFDLDHTLLSGDSDVLWCEFLIERGLLDRDEFGTRNAEMEAKYKAGTVSAEEFAGFYVGTLAGRAAGEMEPLRQEFLARWIVPRIPRDAVELVERHRSAGDLLVLTTATNRFITELTARHFGFEHLIATEAEIEAGTFTGRTAGTLNMRAGKVRRLADWLSAREAALEHFATTGYSDSINDLPLLEAVQQAVAVDPDPRLQAVALERGWKVLRLQR